MSLFVTQWKNSYLLHASELCGFASNPWNTSFSARDAAHWKCNQLEMCLSQNDSQNERINNVKKSKIFWDDLRRYGKNGKMTCPNISLDRCWGGDSRGKALLAVRSISYIHFRWGWLFRWSFFWIIRVPEKLFSLLTIYRFESILFFGNAIFARSFLSPTVLQYRSLCLDKKRFGPWQFCGSFFINRNHFTWLARQSFRRTFEW